jgi:predicted transglutaminase-like cysteine proteinase
LALAKRSRLVRLGYSAGALRLAFVFHREHMSSHCVLTVETTGGTFLLDSQTDEVKRWSEVPYNFEARERQDSRWDRYDQSQWRYQGPISTNP